MKLSNKITYLTSYTITVKIAFKWYYIMEDLLFQDFFQELVSTHLLSDKKGIKS